MPGLAYITAPEEGAVYLFKCTVSHDRREIVGTAKTEWRAGRVKELVNVAGTYSKKPLVQWLDNGEVELVVSNKNEIALANERWLEATRKVAEKKFKLWQNQLKMLEAVEQSLSREK